MLYCGCQPGFPMCNVLMLGCEHENLGYEFRLYTTLPRILPRMLGTLDRGSPSKPANQRAAVRQSGQSAADKTQYLTRWSHSINDRASTRELLLPLLPTNGHCAPKFPILAKFIVGLKQKHLLVGVMLRPRHFKSKNLYKKN